MIGPPTEWLSQGSVGAIAGVSSTCGGCIVSLTPDRLTSSASSTMRCFAAALALLLPVAAACRCTWCSHPPTATASRSSRPERPIGEHPRRETFAGQRRWLRMRAQLQIATT